MINADLSQFLDTGWYSEATLYLNGNTYWCEGYTENNIFYFSVQKYKSEIINKIYTKRIIINNDMVGYSIVYKDSNHDIDEVKRNFLQAPIFDGKSFWQVEKIIAWYDEY